MGNLPTSRTTTHALGDALSSALVDEIQDCIIGRKKSTWTRWFMPSFLSSAAFPAAGNPITGGFPVLKNSGAAGDIFFVPYEDGDTITGFTFYLYGNGSGASSATMYTAASMNVGNLITGGGTALGNVAGSPIPTGWVAYSPGSFTPHVLTNGEILAVEVQAAAANLNLGIFGATFARL
jgi:hypothetical protein